MAAHTSVLASASREFLATLEQSKMVDADRSVLARIDGTPVRSLALAVTTLAQQISSAVDWQACLETSLQMGCRVFLELGPGAGLTRMLREFCSDVAARSVQEFRSLEGVAAWIMKHDDRWRMGQSCYLR